MNEHLGIAGSGAIACGLAATAARHGDVLLWARSAASAERARATVDKVVGRFKDDVDPARVTVVTALEDLAPATVLVEAISEDHGMKVELLQKLAAVAGPDALLATTTSSLSVEGLARDTGDGIAERFVGLHVFNPVPAMELVELVFPAAAGPAARDRARALCEALGKTAVEVPDTPGFVVNRLLFPYLFDAVRFLDSSGMEAKDVDRCMVLGTGQPMGPLALLDFVGLDVSTAIAEEIGVEVPERVRTLVADGALGRKTKRGLLTYG
ncbi:MAG: 3-hydroxyacyl-CoA dehydrogenase family protein [Solirubrobacterales bacterium]|nr:3-hydroxyacyl-CoA dehydrogenase family protein [Solirubrobacterales bacterium]